MITAKEIIASLFRTLYSMPVLTPQLSCSISTRQLKLLLWRVGLTAQQYARFPNLLYTAELCT